MKILVLNSGSSSVKYQVIETDLERMEEDRDLALAVGQVEKIGLSDSRLTLSVPGRPARREDRPRVLHLRRQPPAHRPAARRSARPRLSAFPENDP